MNFKLNIIHVDMDAFFASIEQRDNISLKGYPVIISGNINKRSVVSTCSYEAREYGIRSSMPTKNAYNLCPNGIFIYPRFEYYKSISIQIKKILLGFSDKIEMFSLDEAYLDISNNKLKINDPIELANKIKEKIYNELKLTCSIGVSFNKFLAKIGSDYNKPNGLTVIDENNFENIIDILPIRKIYGIGVVTAFKLRKIGIETGKDLKLLSKEFLFKKFGTRGITIFENIRGIDYSDIITNRVQKSFSKETTFDKDLDLSEIDYVLKKCCLNICDIMKDNRVYCKTVALKLKFYDFTYIYKQITCKDIITSYTELILLVNFLVTKCRFKKKIRLVGIRISNLIDSTKISCTQLSLFNF